VWAWGGGSSNALCTPLHHHTTTYRNERAMFPRIEPSPANDGDRGVFSSKTSSSSSRASACGGGTDSAQQQGGEQTRLLLATERRHSTLKGNSTNLTTLHTRRIHLPGAISARNTASLSSQPKPMRPNEQFEKLKMSVVCPKCGTHVTTRQVTLNPDRRDAGPLPNWTNRPALDEGNQARSGTAIIDVQVRGAGACVVVGWCQGVKV
jgi:hypothetical protein